MMQKAFKVTWLILLMNTMPILGMELSDDRAIILRQRKADLKHLVKAYKPLSDVWHNVDKLIEDEQFLEAKSLLEAYCFKLAEKLELNSESNESGYKIEQLETFFEAFQANAKLLAQKLKNIDKYTLCSCLKDGTKGTAMAIGMVVLLIASLAKPTLMFLPIIVAIAYYSIPLALYLITITGICLLTLNMDLWPTLFFANIANWAFLWFKFFMNDILQQANKTEGIKKIGTILEHFESKLLRKINKFGRNNTVVIEL